MIRKTLQLDAFLAAEKENIFVFSHLCYYLFGFLFFLQCLDREPVASNVLLLTVRCILGHGVVFTVSSSRKSLCSYRKLNQKTHIHLLQPWGHMCNI